MRILFTYTGNEFSKLIQSVTGWKASHCAIEFPLLGLVVHSNYKGVHKEKTEDFYKNNKIYKTLEHKQSSYLDSQEYFDLMMSKYNKKGYDFFGVLFLGIAICLNKHFDTPLPKKNLFQNSGVLFCVEFVAAYTGLKMPIESSMATPYYLYDFLLKSQEWTEK